MFFTIIIFLLLLSILVFVHEFGHFITAKKMGMKVEEFGFGFPPRLFGIKRGETIYSINWIPLGGFVKVKGESGEFKEEQDSFASKPVWKRFIVLVAGVVMNLILTVVLLSIGFWIGIPSVVHKDLPASVDINDKAIRIISVLPQSPADQSGMQMGDKLISIDGQTFEDADGARLFIEEAQGQELSMVFSRADEQKQVFVKAEFLPEVGKSALGIGLVQTALISYPWYLAIGEGITSTAVLTWEILKAFGNLLGNIIIHQEVSMDVSGPVGIAVMTGEVAALGLNYLIQFAALLSLNLAILNILPFPALDGGRVLFLLIEKFRGRAVSEKVEGAIHNLGFLLLMLLVVLVTYRDIVKLFVS
ncbi:RIP metalloprotease RseP [Candidatus Uhrbacteria bacterium CG_4_9_14_3_um_filter_36_7]|uniref:Zinc metalloprotease n=1 Tax=Candidatus Uhrbacteria bacterium CG_4_9_14_3_um_filter_36_7 TaxID=1975033 RepID=A0A2M7XHH2_9BACT|nr:MAG: RIP metalloprotease RseP [Candidatus Uhrbacteria bacterium CG_4_9_14_3_um_filter_36_7]